MNNFQQFQSNSAQKPITNFPHSQLATYRETAKTNLQKSQIQRAQRREKAWQLVEVATSLLKEKFRATKVMVFGSLLEQDRFNLWSDIDIAAWGISPEDTFQAIGEVRELDETIEINLVDVETCQSELLENILLKGKVM
ncbi:nucleotidyltransferase family protein [Gloeothece verrucosa]|uniref:Polymerase beta nucleotidyltransferase domain-containing protein n=1 Tax=Gloeothece verrucosa (strain PCC 7822) TaxID=497965 RepID=E0UMV2_GLOV7|nr:nucleotidyltransferase domain-containing protein [Gloeothece verrucosa]ADN18282.1 hypothetical protein Cyan7822_6508 [Gloeothece verrucosa PCC 7822]